MRKVKQYLTKEKGFVKLSDCEYAFYTEDSKDINRAIVAYLFGYGHKVAVLLRRKKLEYHCHSLEELNDTLNRMIMEIDY